MGDHKRIQGVPLFLVLFIFFIFNAAIVVVIYMHWK